MAIVTDDDLEEIEVLQYYPCLILSNSACISDKQAATLAQYVEKGGGLVASYETGVFDENGTRRQTPALRDLMGMVQGESKSGVDWTISTDTSHDIINAPAIREGGDISQGAKRRKAKIRIFQAHVTRQAGVVKTASAPRAEVQAVPLVGAGGNYSLLGTRSFGSGRTAFFAPDMGRAFFSYNHSINRLLIRRAVEWAARATPQIATDAPMTVQTVCYEKGEKRLVHLVNDVSSFGRSAAPNPESFGGFRDEVLPVHDINVSIEGDYSKALLLPEGKELKVTLSEHKTSVQIPVLELHSLVVFEKD